MVIEARRWTAVTLGVLGTMGLAVAVSVGGAQTYVSEAGVPGSGHPVLYRASVLAISVCAALTATLGLPRLTAVIVATAAAPMALSAAVSCTQGCPLPPFEESTPSDLIHAAGSIAGISLCALAMVALTTAPQSRGRMRSVSLIAIALGWPLLIGTAVGIATIGRSAVTGVLERLGLAVCLIWLITVAALSRSGPPTGPEDRA